MSLLHFDGFEGIGDTGMSSGNLQYGLVNRYRMFEHYGNTGTSAIRNNDLSDGYGVSLGNTFYAYDCGLYVGFDANQVSYTLTAGMRFRPPNTNDSGRLIVFLSNILEEQIRLRCVNGNELRVERGTTQIGTWTGLVDETWHYIEIEVVFHDTAGTVKVWVDDTLRIDLSSQDTINTANGVWNVRFGHTGQTSTSWPAIDDLYILNNQGTRFNSRLGKNTRIYWSSPDGDEGTNNWTPSTGSDHYAVVDEKPEVSDADYLELTSATGTELFDMENTTKVVKAVRPEFVAQSLTSGGGHRDLRLKQKDGSNTVNGTTQPFAQFGDKRFMFELWETDPSGNDWTTTNFNAVKLGFEQVS